MNIKRIKKLRVNSYNFIVAWDKDLNNAGSVSYTNHKITIGVRGGAQSEIFETICHELWELCAMEMHVHFRRPDCDTDFIFVYDHRQHDTMTNMFAGLLSQFIR